MNEDTSIFAFVNPEWDDKENIERDGISTPLRSSCGYCSPRSRTQSGRMYYLIAINLALKDYQELLDQGWRRSGRYTLYLPDNNITCCPMHSIRVPVDSFIPTKTQKYKWRKWIKYIGLSIDPQIHDWQALIPKTFSPPLSDKESNICAWVLNDLELKTYINPIIDQESYDLFIKYQREVHKDPVDRWSKEAYKEFLIDSPLEPTKKHISGTIHQRYYHKGKLIGVSILDILPGHCLSSVYFYYDPDIGSIYNLGSISVLFEIWQCKHVFNVPFYYLGYYIHSCGKMRYKADYRPSFLLQRKVSDNNSRFYSWVPLEGPDSCKAILDNDPHLLDASFKHDQHSSKNAVRRRFEAFVEKVGISVASNSRLKF
jgi:arginine-tRNA-protein transferase